MPTAAAGKPAQTSPTSVGEPDETAREILLRFCRTTSLRGIPRIVSADSRLLRALWLGFVSALVLACVFNLHQIVSLYLAYDVVQMPVHELRPDAAFPSITVCNQIPLSVSGRKLIYSSGWRSPRRFWSSVLGAKRELNQLNLTEEERRHVGMYLAGLFSLNGYFANLPFGHSPSDLGFAKDQLIRSCFLLVRNLDDTREPPVSSPHCEALGEWRRVHDQNRLNCFTYAVRAGVRDPVVEMEMRLFLGHDLGLPCDDCITMDMNTQITGARIVLHENGSFPDVSKEGFNVYPGTLTEVRFSTSNWTRLKPPHGECEDVEAGDISLYGHRFGYSRDACKKAQQQGLIERQCGCTFAFLPHSVSNASAFCERLDDDINTFTPAGLARAAIRSRCGLLGMFRSVKTPCPQPCSSLTFETSTTQAQWPRESMQLHLFESELWRHSGLRLDSNASELTDPELSQAHKEEAQIQQLYLKVKRLAAHDKDEATQLISRHGLISKSFLTLKVTRKDFAVVQLRDKPVRTLASTLSQIGGLLSMWIGLTLIWIVELLELLIRLCWHLRNRLRSATAVRLQRRRQRRQDRAAVTALAASVGYNNNDNDSPIDGGGGGIAGGGGSGGGGGAGGSIDSMRAEVWTDSRLLPLAEQPPAAEPRLVSRGTRV